MTKTFEEEFDEKVMPHKDNLDLMKVRKHFTGYRSGKEFETKENELKRLRKLNHLYKKAKDNAERMAVDRGEALNQAQDDISSLKSQLVAREKQVKELREADKAQGKEIVQLKSQLQQQALPVVKDFVAKWYEEHKDDLDFSIFEACVNLHDDNSSDFEKWFGNSENKSIETLVRMKDGYTVEKPQLFYLKHIDMSKTDEHYDYFAQIRNDRFEHESVQNNTLPGVEVVGVRFTQAEIESMQTGSYEQIKVEDH